MAHLSATRTTGRLPRPGQRRSGHKKAAAERRTAGLAANGFLKARFQPLLEDDSQLKAGRSIERDFFRSLSHLAVLYGFEPEVFTGTPYPANIAAAYRYAVKQLQATNPDVELLILQDEGHPACLATTKVLDTGRYLYYIPLRPLRDLLRNPRQRQTANLLLSVCAYLYQVVGIPCYANNDSYLTCVYELLEEWVMDSDEEDEEHGQQVSDIHTQEWFGTRLTKMMAHPYHLAHFGERVRRYVPHDEQGAALWRIAEQFLSLYEQYPTATLPANIHSGWVGQHEEYRIYVDQYVSFYWDYADTLFPQLEQYVNDEFQEAGAIDEPTAYQLFDRPHMAIADHKLPFEQQLFDLIKVLNQLL